MILKKLNTSQRFLAAVLIIIAVCAIYLILVLMSFHTSDPSWSKTAWNEPIRNLGGCMGAWIADMMLFIFGAISYGIPLIMLMLCWIAYQQQCSDSDYINYFSLSLRLIGTLAIPFACCGLAALNFDDLYYFSSGGVIGSLLSNIILTRFSGIGATLILLGILSIGITLFTGLSWLTIAERIGGAVPGVAIFIINRFHCKELNCSKDSRVHINKPPSKEEIADTLDSNIQLPEPKVYL